jgi:hypothetical protein
MLFLMRRHTFISPSSSHSGAGELAAVLAGTDEKSDHRRAGVGIGEDDADEAKGVRVPTPSDVGEADMVAKL